MELRLNWNLMFFFFSLFFCRLSLDNVLRFSLPSGLQGKGIVMIGHVTLEWQPSFERHVNRNEELRNSSFG